MAKKGFLMALAGLNSKSYALLIPEHKRILANVDARLSRLIVWLHRKALLLFVVGVIVVIAYFLLRKGG